MGFCFDDDNEGKISEASRHENLMNVGLKLLLELKKDFPVVFCYFYV